MLRQIYNYSNMHNLPSINGPQKQSPRLLPPIAACILTTVQCITDICAQRQASQEAATRCTKNATIDVKGVP